MEATLFTDQQHTQMQKLSVASYKLSKYLALGRVELKSLAEAITLRYLLNRLWQSESEQDREFLKYVVAWRLSQYEKYASAEEYDGIVHYAFTKGVHLRDTEVAIKRSGYVYDLSQMRTDDLIKASEEN